MVNLLHYDLISEFKRKFYKDLLTVEHLVGPQIKLDKMSFPNGEVDDKANFWGYVLEKGGKKYLLSSKTADGGELDLHTTLPIIARGELKVASKGIVYHWIKKPVSAKIRPSQTMSFKDMVNKLCSLEHTNPTHQKLLWFMTLSQMYDRANYRFCTPAGFGKDSTVDIIGNLIGSACTIENPTLAKLEFMTNNKLLAINEVVDVKRADWRTMEQFLLSTGAHKPEVTKHSRATSNGVKEMLDISKFSISLMYNDIDHYPDEESYFDKVTKKAVKDRFPSLRLYGTFTENFNSIKEISINDYVIKNYDKFVEIVSNYTYYKINHMDTYHSYRVEGLRSMPERWKLNIGRLLKIVDVYCDTQEEFNEWVKIVNDSMQDYEDMLKYPKNLAEAHKKLTPNEFKLMHDKLEKIPTFTNKLKEMKVTMTGERHYEDVAVHDLW